MHIEDRGMSGPLTGAKPIFPIPISGQVSTKGYIYSSGALTIKNVKKFGQNLFFLGEVLYFEYY